MKPLSALILALLISGCADLPAKKNSAKNAPPSKTLSPSVLWEPQVSAIPNPVRGRKVAFRVIVPGLAKVRLKIYNHFLVEIKAFEQEGSKLFDVIWVFKNLEEGIYYYQANVEDLAGEHVYKLPIQKFVVLHDERIR